MVAEHKGRVLVVDDEPALRRAYARILEAAGFSVEQAADGGQAIAALAKEAFEVRATGSPSTTWERATPGSPTSRS